LAILDNIRTLMAIKVNSFFNCSSLPTQLDQPASGSPLTERLTGEDSKGWENNVVESLFKLQRGDLSLLLLEEPSPSTSTDSFILQNRPRILESTAASS
jgi:hypothetical protein